MTADLLAADNPYLALALSYDPSCGTVVRLGTRLIVIRTEDGSPWPTCVARIEGHRCTTTLFAPTMVGHDVHIVGHDGNVRAWESTLPDECFLRQRCIEHVDADLPDAAKPQWSEFDPDSDGDLIRPYWIAWASGALVPPWDEPSWCPDEGSHDADSCADAPCAEGRERTDAADAPSIKPTTQTALYRWFDSDDLLLYIGISDQLTVRVGSHIRGSSWMDFAVRSTVERFSSRTEAADAEVSAIKAEHPLFNHKHNDSPEAKQRLVEYLVAHGRTDLLMPAISRG